MILPPALPLLGEARLGDSRHPAYKLAALKKADFHSWKHRYIQEITNDNINSLQMRPPWTGQKLSSVVATFHVFWP
jgi:hypothetical protein